MQWYSTMVVTILAVEFRCLGSSPNQCQYLARYDHGAGFGLTVHHSAVTDYQIQFWLNIYVYRVRLDVNFMVLLVTAWIWVLQLFRVDTYVHGWICGEPSTLNF